MSHFPLIVAQYELHGHKKGRNYKHWSIVALRSAQDAYVFEVIGSTGSFVYTPKHVSNFDTSRRFRGGYKVGEIPSNWMNWMSDKLQEVTVRNDDEEWDCQYWVMDALRLLRDTEGIITGNIGRTHIIQELSLDEERWQTMEETVDERLFSRVRILVLL